MIVFLTTKKRIRKKKRKNKKQHPTTSTNLRRQPTNQSTIITTTTTQKEEGEKKWILTTDLGTVITATALAAGISATATDSPTHTQAIIILMARVTPLLKTGILTVAIATADPKPFRRRHHHILERTRARIHMIAMDTRH